MSVQPTYYGYVPETHDALLLFQAVLDGLIEPVSRRPHDQERREIIYSGAVFIFREELSGIKRWTDHITWSPSRILGNFLLYRQLERPMNTGERKVTKRNRRRSNTSSFKYGGLEVSSVGGTSDHPHDASSAGSASSNGSRDEFPPSGAAVDEYEGMSYTGAGRTYNPEWSLYGSLVKDNPQKFQYKENGLVKKTLSVLLGKDHIHLVSYYRASDVKENKLKIPSNNPSLASLRVNPELIRNSGNFRVPLTNIKISQHEPLSHSGHSGQLYGQEYHGDGVYGGEDHLLSASHPYWSQPGPTRLHTRPGLAPGRSNYPSYTNNWQGHAAHGSSAGSAIMSQRSDYYMGAPGGSMGGYPPMGSGAPGLGLGLGPSQGPSQGPGAGLSLLPSSPIGVANPMNALGSSMIYGSTPNPSSAAWLNNSPMYSNKIPSIAGNSAAYSGTGYAKPPDDPNLPNNLERGILGVDGTEIYEE